MVALVAAIVPRKQAMEMLLTGEPIAARAAREIGLVNRVVARHNRERRDCAAEKVALQSAYTVKLGKARFYRQAEMSLADAYRYAGRVMTENMMAATLRKASAPSSRSASRSGRISDSRLASGAKQSTAAKEV